MVNVKKRIPWVDLMETIAMYLVVLYHGTIYAENSELDKCLMYFFRTIISTSVPIFFFVNGYLLFNRKFELKKHILKTIRLIVLTGIWAVITLGLLMVIKNEYLTFSDILKYLWTWKLGWLNHLWYMGALVCIYIFFPLLKVVYDTNKKIFIYFIVVCAIVTFGNSLMNVAATVVSCLLNMGDTFYDVNFFNMFNPLRVIYVYTLVYFCFGGMIPLIYNRIVSIESKKRNRIAIVGLLMNLFLLFGIGIMYSNLLDEMWDVAWKSCGTIFTFLNVFFIFVLCLNFNSDNKLIATISKNTMGIYFLHELFIQLTRPSIMSNPLLCNFFVNIIYAGLIVLVSLAFCIGLKKIPGIRFLLK